MMQKDGGSNTSYTKKHQEHIPCSLSYKFVSIDDKFSKPVVLYRGKNVVNKFIEAVLNKFEYCRLVTKIHFHKKLVMTVKDEKDFESSNKCWICGGLFAEGDGRREKGEGKAHD